MSTPALDRAAIAFAYFVRMGWSPAQAAGLVANLVRESNLDPSAVGDGGQAYGIAQWHPPRQANFRAVIGKDIRNSSLEEQLAFVHAELRSTERAAGEALAACTTAAEAGACVSIRYERPADRDAEAARRAQFAEGVLAKYGGSVGANAPATSTVATPEVNPAATPTTKPEPKTMGALLAFAPLLAQLIPQIAALLKPESEVAKRNVGIAQVLTDTIVQAAGAANLGDAVQKMQESPEVQKAVQQAVVTQPEVMQGLQLMEIGPGGIGGARDANQAAASSPQWYAQFASPVFVMSLALCAMLIMVLGNVLGMPWGGSFQEWSENTRSNVVFAIITGAIGAITGYWFGTTVASNRKDQIIAAQAQQQADKTG